MQVRTQRNTVLISVGRGNVIDEAALAVVLTKGQIAGAVLDVFNEEPLPPDHPFWTASNLILPLIRQRKAFRKISH